MTQLFGIYDALGNAQRCETRWTAKPSSGLKAGNLQCPMSHRGTSQQV